MKGKANYKKKVSRLKKNVCVFYDYLFSLVLYIYFYKQTQL